MNPRTRDIINLWQHGFGSKEIAQVTGACEGAICPILDYWRARGVEIRLAETRRVLWVGVVPLMEAMA